MIKLSDTQAVILSAAAQHPHGLVAPPAKLAPAPCDAVRKSLLAKGLMAPTEVPDRTVAWLVEGGRVSYRITPLALAALGIDTEAPADEGPTAPTDAPVPSPLPEPTPELPAAVSAPTAAVRATLRQAAQQVLAAWDDATTGREGLPNAMDTLRHALEGRAAREAGAPRQPREGTKHAAVLAMLRRPEGATVAQVAEAMTWAPHTVRGFFAGLKRNGITVTVLDRVRQVGPKKQGAKGSYSVYRIAEAG